MRKFLNKSLVLIACFALISACNQKGKEITQDQEDRLNRVDTQEKENADQKKANERKAQELTNKIKEVSDKEKRLNTLEAELTALETELKNKEDEFNSGILNNTKNREQINADRERNIEEANEAREEITRLREELHQKTDNYERLKAELESNQQQLRNDVDTYQRQRAASIALLSSDKFAGGLFAKLIAGQTMPVLFLYTAHRKVEADAIESQIMVATKDPSVKFPNKVDLSDPKKKGNELVVGTVTIAMNSSVDLKVLMEGLNSYSNSFADFYPIAYGRISSYLNIEYNDGKVVTQKIKDGSPFYIGEKFNSVKFGDPLKNNLPTTCKRVNAECLRALSEDLNKDGEIIEKKSDKVTKKTGNLKNFLVSELERSSSAWSGYISKLTISSILSVEGPTKAENLNRVGKIHDELKEKSLESEAVWLKTPIGYETYTSSDFGKLVNPEYSRKVGSLAEALE